MPPAQLGKGRKAKMIRKASLVFLLWLALLGQSFAQENYLIAYGDFAGFQVPVWAAKDLGLLTKYGLTGDVVMVPGSTREIQALLGGAAWSSPRWMPPQPSTRSSAERSPAK